MIYDNTAKNICFENEKYISFISPTVILPHDFLPINIPFHVFDFTNLANLPETLQHHRYLIGITQIFIYIYQLTTSYYYNNITKWFRCSWSGYKG